MMRHNSQDQNLSRRGRVAYVLCVILRIINKTCKAESLLGWRPPVDTAVELAAAATWYREQVAGGKG